MSFQRIPRSAFRLVIISIILCSLSIEVQAIAAVDSLQLTKQKVRDWIETRIATNKLQNKMKANAAQYDDVVQAFFAKRKTLLQSRGWTVGEFESVEKRISAATTAMDIAEDLEESKDDHEEQIAEIKSNEYFTKEQKEQMIKVENRLREQQRVQFIEPTKPDWPAVKPYRSTLEELTDWVAGNISNPPEVP